MEETTHEEKWCTWTILTSDEGEASSAPDCELSSVVTDPTLSTAVSSGAGGRYRRMMTEALTIV
jgi:hypothetical protein